ncbi:MAG: restriction endonuclease subunit S, partial [Gallionella sp.]
MKAGWQTKTFGDVLDIRNGKNQREVESADGEYPIYGSAGNVMGYATSYICRAGATIVGRKGNINTPIYTETNFWNVDTAFGLEAKSELDSRFLYYFCLTYDFSLLNRGTTIPSLVKSDLLQIKIPTPPLLEQQRIVGILDDAFDGIATAKANAEQNLQNAHALFESHLQSVFTQRGEGWVVKSLEDVVDADCTLSYGIVQPGDEFAEGLPVVRPTDLTSKLITLSGLKRIDPKLAGGYRRTTLRGGELLLCVRG